MVFSRSDGTSKIVVDSVHGDIHLKEAEVRVIDTASFQRLRQLKQLAMAQLVYPNATHTRFAHSIGALGTGMRIVTDLWEERVVTVDFDLERAGRYGMRDRVCLGREVRHGSEELAEDCC